MDPLSIGALILSALVTNKTQTDAMENQRRAAVQSQQQALASQNQATDAALRRVQEFDPTTRKESQDEIQSQLTDQYQKAAVATPITAQGIQVGQTIPDAAGGADYLKARAAETAKATNSNRNLAALFGRIGSAGQLRRNEAVGIGDTAGEIGRIQTGANNMANIDQIGIQSAGQPSLGGMLLGSALGAYGTGSGALSGLGDVAKSKYLVDAGTSYANPSVMQAGAWLRK